MSRVRLAIGALALSAAGLVGIATWEGYSGTAYVPVPGDVPTIGFGTTEGVKLGDKITPPVALARALRDVEKHDIGRCVEAPLTQGEYDAYTSLAYNIGVPAFCSSTLVRKLNAGDYAGACKEILRWNRGPNGVLQGLVNRRASEHALCVGSSSSP